MKIGEPLKHLISIDVSQQYEKHADAITGRSIPRLVGLHGLIYMRLKIRFAIAFLKTDENR